MPVCLGFFVCVFWGGGRVGGQRVREGVQCSIYRTSMYFPLLTAKSSFCLWLLLAFLSLMVLLRFDSMKLSPTPLAHSRLQLPVPCFVGNYISTSLFLEMCWNWSYTDIPPLVLSLLCVYILFFPTCNRNHVLRWEKIETCVFYLESKVSGWLYLV